MEEVVLKALPKDVEDFKIITTQNYYYVDKTWFIKEFLDWKGAISIFTRPKQFGKSLFMSMLQYFFDSQYADKKHVFEGLRIMEASEAYFQHQNAYPVIKMTFKNVKGSTFETALNGLMDEITREYGRHEYLLKSEKLLQYEKENFKRLLKKRKIEGFPKETREQHEQRVIRTSIDYLSALQFISHCLYKHHGKKVIVLIDDCDLPLEKAYFNDYYEPMIDLIHGILSQGLKSNEAVDFAVLTGCLRVIKESHSSGFNNYRIFSILSNQYAEYIGFTSVEVQEMLDYYGLSHKYNEMCNWFNGYLFGEKTIYNPWSCIVYLIKMLANNKYFVKLCWENSASNIIVKELINANDEARDELEDLIAGGTITKLINEGLIHANILKNQNNMWNFLYFMGYLALVKKMQSGVMTYFELKIPNKEFLSIYKTQIRDWFDERVKETDRTTLYRAVLEQDVTSFEDEVAELLQKSISYMDSQENFYHGFLTGILGGLEGYRVISNRETGKRRGDIFLKPYRSRKRVVIIKVKVVKEAIQMESECDKALTQIKEKEYEDELRQEGYTDIISYGIAFYRKDCLIKADEHTATEQHEKFVAI